MSVDFRDAELALKAVEAALPGADRCRIGNALALALGMAISNDAWPQEPNRDALILAAVVIASASRLRHSKLAAERAECAGRA